MPTPADPFTLLIIDDTPHNLGVVIHLFETRGYRVAITQNGEEGVQRATLLQPDLILLDKMLPGIDGLEICRRLKAQEHTRDIPIIFITAHTDSDSKAQAFEVGAADYLTKPLQIDETIARVQTHLELHAMQRQLAAQNRHLNRHVNACAHALSKSKCRFCPMTENLPDHIVRHNLACRVTYFNPAVLKHLAQEVQPVLGMRPTESHPANAAAQEYQKRLEHVLSTGHDSDITMELPNPNRVLRAHHLRIVAERNAAGTVVGTLSIGRDITDHKHMAYHLEESQRLLRQLAARNEDAREDERRHLKREIHDELGQYLSALRLGLSVVDIQLGQAHSPLQNNTQHLIKMLDNTIQTVRNVVAALRPAALDVGIVAALEWLAQDFTSKTDTLCELQISGDDLNTAMNDKSATAVFRIVQESLTNIVRHAHATQVNISLTQHEGHCMLEVHDNGRGFDHSARKEASFGLIGIKERALMLGGEVNIVSVPGHTTIRVRFPNP